MEKEIKNNRTLYASLNRYDDYTRPLLDGDLTWTMKNREQS
jgi:hypothetical protein